MAAEVESVLDLTLGTTFVMSTGVIGQHLPMDKIRSGIANAARTLSRNSDDGHNAAKAIMTTDTRPKEAAVRLRVGGRIVTIAGICKGAGMIHPNMATMLAMFVTDAAIESSMLQRALSHAVEHSFNAVTVDGDTSTNDTVVVLANGIAANTLISSPETPVYDVFQEGLTEVATVLAQKIARDGEGATKFITIRVTGALTAKTAQAVAKAVATSTLVKTAIYGQDANWGRVLCAAGNSGVEIDQDRLALWMSNGTDALQLVQNGAPFEIDEARAADILAGQEITLHLDLGLGREEATVWTCDLSHEYIDINAHYRT
jgi:glutamate N-acetyltransferase/amino-acid N-acetyltransferase